jgi:UTP--glucose-1-phosphate uridylyltransferase
VRSDAYELTPERHLEVIPDRGGVPPLVELDGKHFKLIDDFDARFPAGPPSLAEAERLRVVGDVTFGRDVVVRGAVTVEGPRQIPDGEVLSG